MNHSCFFIRHELEVDETVQPVRDTAVSSLKFILCKPLLFSVNYGVCLCAFAYMSTPPPPAS